MSGDQRSLMKVFRRLQALYGEDRLAFPAEPDPSTIGRIGLSLDVVQRILDDLPAWQVWGDAEAIEKSMTLGHREEGLIVHLHLALELAKCEEPVAFRVVWEETRLRLRLWARSGGVTDAVVALAWSLESTLFPLQAPAQPAPPPSDPPDQDPS